MQQGVARWLQARTQGVALCGSVRGGLTLGGATRARDGEIAGIILIRQVRQGSGLQQQDTAVRFLCSSPVI